jgi:uncharacterized Zn finger protein (UPF0148 family)
MKACPECGNGATKIVSLNTGEILCQVGGHRYFPTLTKSRTYTWTPRAEEFARAQRMNATRKRKARHIARQRQSVTSQVEVTLWDCEMAVFGKPLGKPPGV